MCLVKHPCGNVVGVDPSASGQPLDIVRNEYACPCTTVEYYVVGLYVGFIKDMVDYTCVGLEHRVPFSAILLK